MFPLNIHPKAKEEFLESVLWYNDRGERLGDRFEQTIYDLLERIREKPDLYGFSRRPFREATVKVFPFTIIYELDKKNNTIYIHSIYHGKRNPSGKFRRFDK